MYPETYLMLLGLVLGIAFFLVRGLLPSQAWQPSMFSFFFLGGGFMLIETKAITELGLLFGNTWQVVGITIASVLVMAYLANSCRGAIDAPALVGCISRHFGGLAYRLHHRDQRKHSRLGPAGKGALGCGSRRSFVFFRPRIFDSSERHGKYIDGHGLQPDGCNAGRGARIQFHEVRVFIPLFDCDCLVWISLACAAPRRKA